MGLMEAQQAPPPQPFFYFVQQARAGLRSCKSSVNGRTTPLQALSMKENILVFGLAKVYSLGSEINGNA